jgi:hypothetical protein
MEKDSKPPATVLFAGAYEIIAGRMNESYNN